MPFRPEATGPLTGREDLVTSVAWSPDGAHFASGGSDRIVRVWDAETGEPVRVLLTGPTARD